MAVTVTRKEQVTIPKPVRDRLGIHRGASSTSKWPRTVAPFCAEQASARQAEPLRADPRHGDGRPHHGMRSWRWPAARL